MRTYQLGDDIRGLIFDMDNTLYTNQEYACHQEDVLVERLAQELQISPRETQTRVDAWRDSHARANGGRKPSLGNTFVALGVDIETSVEWRRECLQPELFLSPDPALVDALADLAIDYRLAVVTNNPVEIARRTLAILGVVNFIPVIVGLDSTNVSKPDPAAFRLAANALDCDGPSIVSIGDRYEVDIEPALGLGMGGLLVSGVEEVCALPEYFRSLKKM